DREVAAWRARVPALLGLDGAADGGVSAQGRFTLWRAEYASVAVTRADVDEALRRFDAEGLRADPYDPWLAPDELGALLVRGGRFDEAIPLLRGGAAQCSITSDPGGVIRASLFLGEALEAKSDIAGACAAYAKVLQRWGAGARSHSA